MYLKDQQVINNRLNNIRHHCSSNNNNRECQLKEPSLEDLMKQLATSNLEFQQTMSSSNMQLQQNMNATIQNLKTRSNLATYPHKPFQIRDGMRVQSRYEVEINIPFLDAIKQIPKYAKFLKELCVHKRKKMKGSVEVGGIILALTRNEDFTVGAQTLPKKCQDPRIFSIPCTIGDCTFADAMLDLGASINVMPMSIYKSLNFGDLEPTRMIIQLANRSVVQPLGILKDVLIQVNELIFPANFYVLDMEDETSGKGSTLVLG
ncbi:hypothetical protein CR513_12618, partial [Mucuna pruriens]